MSENEEIKELIRIVWYYVAPWFWLAMIITTIIAVYDYLKPEEAKPKRDSYWLNDDPTRPATDVARYDYDNRILIYREYNDNTARDRQAAQQTESSRNTPFTDWYDASDYYDLYEYYHD